MDLENHRVRRRAIDVHQRSLRSRDRRIDLTVEEDLALADMARRQREAVPEVDDRGPLVATLGDVIPVREVGGEGVDGLDVRARKDIYRDLLLIQSEFTRECVAGRFLRWIVKDEHFSCNEIDNEGDFCIILIPQSA